MTDNTELQRLTRLHRLGRQIVASLPADLDCARAVQAHGYLRELPMGAPRDVSKPTSGRAALRAQLEAAQRTIAGALPSARRRLRRSLIAAMN